MQGQEKTKTLTPSLLGYNLKRQNVSHLFVSLLAIAAAIATAGDGQSVQWMERQAQTIFQRWKPTTAPPPEIVIVALDDHSFTQGELYLQTPEQLPHLEPLQRWPWKREAYAIVAQRLMQAGAKAVALDLILDSPSVYGPEDDAKLQKVLQTYPGRIVLGAVYEGDRLRSGELLQLTKPHQRLQVPDTAIGSINYPLEADDRIHRFASEFPKLWANNNPDLAEAFSEFVATVPSFTQATLQAAGSSYPKPKGDNIFFYGPAETFEQISFADLLDSENWNTYLQEGEYFRNKIVLIGPTSESLKDFHLTPMPGLMAGVEVQANVIATLLEGRSIAETLPNAKARGLFVFAVVLGVGLFVGRQKQWPMRAVCTFSSAIAWAIIGYAVFMGGREILPIAVPLVGIIFSGLSSAAIGAIEELRRKRQLREKIKYYVSSPIVREIIAQQEDLQDLLEERDREILAMTLGNRYKVLQKLSSGGFGETYLARDLQRPGEPICVVKQLRPASNNPKHWELAKRLLLKEAEILEKLGHHDQIPQLLAYFEEENEFYLIEEWIDGHPLDREFPSDVPLSEARVIAILQDLLSILEFVHDRGVIHRDIKPENIIRRKSDRKLVLIDFGAVKEVRAQWADAEDANSHTIAIGSRGYTPREQSVGHPKFNSDIYAAGMVAIRAFTLLHPAKLGENSETGEILWEDKAQVSPEFAAILNRMIRSDFRDRYQSVSEVLADLQPLITGLSVETASTSSVMLGEPFAIASPLESTAATVISSDVSSETFADPEAETSAIPDSSSESQSQSS